MARFLLKNDETKELIGAPGFTFPKYTTQLMNLANQNAQGTRPSVVGQMSELIQEFPGRSLDEWTSWYLARHPKAIQAATQKVLSMTEQLREAIEKIDATLVEQWVHDLVVVKTYAGLRFQQAILKKVAETLGKPFRGASPDEESRGIDGILGGRRFP